MWNENAKEKFEWKNSTMRRKEIHKVHDKKYE